MLLCIVIAARYYLSRPHERAAEGDASEQAVRSGPDGQSARSARGRGETADLLHMQAKPAEGGRQRSQRFRLGLDRFDVPRHLLRCESIRRAGEVLQQHLRVYQQQRDAASTHRRGGLCEGPRGALPRASRG